MTTQDFNQQCFGKAVKRLLPATLDQPFTRIELEDGTMIRLLTGYPEDGVFPVESDFSVEIERVYSQAPIIPQDPNGIPEGNAYSWQALNPDLIYVLDDTEYEQVITDHTKRFNAKDSNICVLDNSGKRDQYPDATDTLLRVVFRKSFLTRIKL